MQKRSFLTAFVIAMIAGAGLLGHGTARAQSADPAKLDDLEIAHAAYTADVIDIDYAKIALAKSKNPEVIAFANLMIQDHSAVNEGAGALLKKLNVQPKDNAFSQALVKGAEAKKAELAALEGAAFDKAYAANELAYHQVVNKIVAEAWLPNIKNPDLKVFVEQASVTFKIHEDHANKMVAALK
jgi:putative membrane protein